MNDMQRMEPRPSRKARAAAKPPKLSVEERLLEAIKRLLAKKKNFAQLTVDQLAREAGISRGTFYVHFKDRTELVARLIEHLTEVLVDSLGNWGKSVEWATKEDVNDAVAGMVHSLYQHRAIIIAIRDTMIVDPQIRTLYEAMISHISAHAQQSVATVIRQGDSREGMTIRIGNVLTWIVALYANDIIGKTDESGLEEAIEDLQHICTATIFSDK